MKGRPEQVQLGTRRPDRETADSRLETTALGMHDLTQRRPALVHYWLVRHRGGRASGED
jgi:hypothetical protein